MIRTRRTSSPVDGPIFKSRDELVFKIIVIGDPGVGKASLLNNFLNKRFEEKYIHTVGVNILKEEVMVSDKKGNPVMVNLMFWVISGRPQFYMLYRPYFNGANGMILMYDITHFRSFLNIIKWYALAVRYGLSRIPRILVGIIKDLIPKREVSRPMAETLSKILNAPFFETSVLTGRGINVIFQKIADLTYQSKLMVL